MWYRFILPKTWCRRRVTGVRLGWLLAGLLLAGTRAGAAEISITVHDVSGKPLESAVVWVSGDHSPISGQLPPVSLDQRNLNFDPGILGVSTGTEIRFFNSDTVNHHVYSFSAGELLDVKLDAGEHGSITHRFDHPGVYILGCNIHDWMLAYIQVVDATLLGQTNADGVAAITMPGAVQPDARIHVWHPRLNEEISPRPVNSVVQIKLAKKLKPDPWLRQPGYN